MSEIWYSALVLFVAIERLAELAIARRHARWSRARGGIEHGHRHYRFMVALHTGLLIGAVAEVWIAGRPFIPWLGWPMLVLLIFSQGLRWWCISTLGPQWNTRVIIVPGLSLVRHGPYRWFRHPNYVAVVLEGLALPLVHSAWMTAAVFSILNAVLLTVRIRVENAALAELDQAVT